MTIFDESTPWTPAHFRKYKLYLAMRKEREKFLESLREMTYCEWKINKRLIEAGGLGKTVYILPARGGQRSYLPFIKKYLEEGRDVVPVTLNKSIYPKLSGKDFDVIRESIRQFELYSKLVNPWRDNPLYEQTLFRDFYPQKTGPGRIMIRSVDNPHSPICDYEQLIKRTYLGKWEEESE